MASRLGELGIAGYEPSIEGLGTGSAGSGVEELVRLKIVIERRDTSKRLLRDEIREMGKTPIASRFMHQLIKVNNQVCFSALRHWEFERILAPLIDSRPTEYTSSVFATNPFSESIYRKISDLTEFSQEAEQVALRMGVIASVEHVLAYLEEAHRFGNHLVGRYEEKIAEDAEEKQLCYALKCWTQSEIEGRYFKTIGYMRLLRNHYAHLNSTPHQAFKTYVRKYGATLNNFWSNDVTDIHGVDFKSLIRIDLTPHLSFGILNLLRICLLHVDGMLCNAIDINNASKHQIEEIFKSANNRQLRVDRIASKLRAQLKEHWNININVMEAIVQVERLTNRKS